MSHNDYPWLKGYPDDVNWEAQYKPGNLVAMFDQAVIDFADKSCCDFMGKKLSFLDIGELVNRAAKGLQDLGVKEGDKVGIVMPNCPYYIIFYYAVLKIGAVAVNYNPLYTISELEYQVNNSNTKILITLDLSFLAKKARKLRRKNILEKVIICPFAEILPFTKKILYKIVNFRELYFSSKSRNITRYDNIMANDGSYNKVTIHPDKLALLQYTGGTTGVPKGAMLSHNNLHTNVKQISDWFTNLTKGEERMLAALPFFHVFAMTTVMNFGIYNGCELILMPRFKIKEVIKLIRDHNITIMVGVPTIFNAIINFPKINKSDLKHLKYSFSGGASLPVAVKHEFEALSSCVLVEGYGLSETSPVVTANPCNGRVKSGSIGLPVPETIVSIRSIDNPENEVKHGEDGEICIKGPQVMLGYWQRDDATEKSFVGDYFRTGDVGHFDDEGFIYLIDRIKDLINCSGFKVYPRHIEDAIYKHPAVEEVIVIGIPDEYRGEAPKAFIKLHKGQQLDPSDIIGFLDGKLSKIEIPDHIEFRDELPKTMIGKLSKKELRENT